ncbi:MAG: hypothetical protein AB7C89_05590 [Intestinibacillus sp.]
MYAYGAVQWLLFFYIYCFLGWCFESTVVSLQERRFINRGFLHGPVVPLYGTGAVLLLLVALPLQNQPPALLFLAGMAAATVLEYVVGAVMEAVFKVKYWDYTGHRMQVRGRICLQSSLTWGALTLILTGLIHPPVERLVLRLPGTAALVAAAAITVLFVSDALLSVRTALDLARILGELTHLRAQADELRRQLAALAEETRQRLAEAADGTRERLSETAETTRERLTEAAQDTREKLSAAAAERMRALQEALDASTASYEERMRKLRLAAKMLVRAYPGAVSRRFGRALEELKDRLRQR